MPDVNVKMGVTGLGQYKSAMTQLESITKRTDSALKLSEKQFKQTGDAEEYMAQKSGNLKLKLSAQEQMVKATQRAMAQLTEQGVDPLSKRYQDLERKLQDTQSAMIDTQQQIAELGQTSTTATGQTDKLEKSLSGLNKKVSLEQVTNGIKGITSAMENAVKMAGNLGRAIWNNVVDSARWADDTATAASILGMDVEEYQRYARTFETIGDITVADWMNAKRRIQSAIYSPTSDQVDIFAALGISTHTMQAGKYGIVEGAAREYEDILWEVGTRLREMVESGQIDAGLADVYAMEIFGKSYASLNPLFDLGREAFYEAVNKQEVVSEDSVDKLAKLNDSLEQLKGNFETLKTEVLAGLAPALTTAADAISGLLTNLIEYLHTPEGQEMLDRLGTAVSGLFEDLSKIDPASVVNNFVSVFETIIGGLEWLVENKDTVITALGAIVAGWAGLKLTGGALDILKLVNGIKGLGGGGSGGSQVLNTVTGGGGETATGGIVAKIAAKLGGKEAIKAAAVAAAGPVIGTLGGMALLGGIAAVAASNNYTYRGIGDAHRFSNVDNPKQLQTAVRGILNANDSNAEWKLGYLTAGIATPEEMFGLFDYEDAEKGKQNYLLGIAGQNAEVRAAMYQMYTHRFGGLNTETFNSLPAEYRAALLAGQEAYGNIQASGGTLDYTALLSGMRTYFQDYGVFNSEGEWTIPIDTEVAEGAAEQLQEQLDGMGLYAPVKLIPFNGYDAMLNRGSNSLGAANSSNYTSNVYFGSVNLNNGMEVEALTESIDRRNRNVRKGYGT